MKKMGRPKETKKVDSEKVKQILAQNHITMTKLSQNMGFHESYVSGLLRQGELSKYVVTYLKNTYGVSYNEYRYCSNNVQNAEQTEENSNMTDSPIQTPEISSILTQTGVTVDLSDSSIEKLADAVYKAVYSAVVVAWKDM